MFHDGIKKRKRLQIWQLQSCQLMIRFVIYRVLEMVFKQNVKKKKKKRKYDLNLTYLLIPSTIMRLICLFIYDKNDVIVICPIIYVFF